MDENRSRLILFLLITLVIVVASSILLIYYGVGEWGSSQIYDIASIGSPEKAFEEGHIDGLVYVVPEVSEISISGMNIPPNTVVKVKLVITYVARRDPAPKILEIVFDTNGSSTLIPTGDGYIRLEDYMRVEPAVVYVSVDRNATTYLYINFTQTLIDAIKYNMVKLGRTESPSIQVSAYITANKLAKKSYKYIWISWKPSEIKIKG